jgi:NAD(P)H-hydrate repair Nnr-like enzyme with NAD(P)H-hydrate epimerase domain
MDKAHEVEQISFSGSVMFLRVDGRDYEVDISFQSQRLASATLAQLQNYIVSPSGYGIHWPDIDEDLSVDGLIGVKHRASLKKSAGQPSERDSMQVPSR